MVRNAQIPDRCQYMLADVVIQHAFAFDHVFFLCVKGGGVIFKRLHQGSSFRPFKNDLGLAFIELLSLCHDRLCPCEKVAGISGYPKTRLKIVSTC